MPLKENKKFFVRVTEDQKLELNLHSVSFGMAEVSKLLPSSLLAYSEFGVQDSNWFKYSVLRSKDESGKIEHVVTI